MLVAIPADHPQHNEIMRDVLSRLAGCRRVEPAGFDPFGIDDAIKAYCRDDLRMADNLNFTACK